MSNQPNGAAVSAFLSKMIAAAATRPWEYLPVTVSFIEQGLVVQHTFQLIKSDDAANFLEQLGLESEEQLETEAVAVTSAIQLMPALKGRNLVVTKESLPHIKTVVAAINNGHREPLVDIAQIALLYKLAGQEFLKLYKASQEALGTKGAVDILIEREAGKLSNEPEGFPADLTSGSGVSEPHERLPLD